MNRLLALINIVCCSIWTGCSSVNIKTLDECPVVIQTETIAGHPLTVCDQKLLNDTLQIPLSLLAENLEIIHFDNREEALMGEHQVVLSDNYMLVWHSDVQPAKLFDRKGKFLTTIGAKGQANTGRFTMCKSTKPTTESICFPGQSANYWFTTCKGMCCRLFRFA